MKVKPIRIKQARKDKGIKRGKLIGAYADNFVCFFYMFDINRKTNGEISMTEYGNQHNKIHPITH